jgi:hypothetical protein
MDLIDNRWKKLGWQHPMWELVRYFCSLRGTAKEKWMAELRKKNRMQVDGAYLKIDSGDINLLLQYLECRDAALQQALGLLRTEKEALLFCKRLKMKVGKTRTKNLGHHQSSKALIATVSTVAANVCQKRKMDLEANPQTRCVWSAKNMLHVTARNLDGAIPSLLNPKVIWEIKEYWGKTSGGSKMSDAVYETNLVGKDLREYEAATGIRVAHVLFLDGKEQWLSRKSDLARFIDLANQGLVDYLFVGKQVEEEWGETLEGLLK